MPSIVCSVPESHLNIDQLKRLEAAFVDTYSSFFHTEEIAVLWFRVADGQVYSGGEIGDAFVAFIEVDNGLEQSKRERVLLTLNQHFSEYANIGTDKALVIALDSEKMNEYQQANQNRLCSLSKTDFGIQTQQLISDSQQAFGIAALDPNR